MKRWNLIKIDFHRRWRGGITCLDLKGDNILSHHGWYSLQWARGPHIEYYRAARRG